MLLLAFDRGLLRFTVKAPHNAALLRLPPTSAKADVKALSNDKVLKDLRDWGLCSPRPRKNTVI